MHLRSVAKPAPTNGQSRLCNLALSRGGLTKPISPTFACSRLAHATETALRRIFETWDGHGLLVRLSLILSAVHLRAELAVAPLFGRVDAAKDEQEPGCLPRRPFRRARRRRRVRRRKYCTMSLTQRSRHESYNSIAQVATRRSSGDPSIYI